MPTSVIEQLRRVLLRDSAAIGDGELLGGFIDRRDETALAALIQRHGKMVWGVCRRLLSHHDAEDAFQATFVVLARRAASINPREMVGNWLYGVAHQTALHARRTIARRRSREVQVTDMAETEVVRQDQWPLLDQELSRLPDNYRAVLVLCDLEDRTRKEAARQLGVPEGTVAGRLARARAMLAKRLAQRGITLSGGALAAVLSQNAASAIMPASVLSSAITVAVGQSANSSKVAALAEGVVKAMLMSKLKAVLAIVLVLGVVATGVTLRPAVGQDDKKPVAEKPVEPAAKQGKPKDQAIVTAWGNVVEGVQAGLGFRAGEHRAYRIGETVRLVVRARNLGKKEVKLSYFNESYYENPPVVTDDKGKPVSLEGAELSGLPVLLDVKLPPGKEVPLCEMYVELRADTGRPVWALYGTGKFHLHYEKLPGNIETPQFKFDPILSKLATGTLELEVQVQKATGGEGDNPFRRCKVGDWIEYKVIKPKTAVCILRTTVASQTDKEVRCDGSAKNVKNGDFATWSEGEAIDLTKPYVEYAGGVMKAKGFEVEIVEEGKSIVEIGKTKFDATWCRMKVYEPKTKKRSVRTMWHSAEVPFGGILKVEEADENGPIYRLEYMASGTNGT